VGFSVFAHIYKAKGIQRWGWGEGNRFPWLVVRNRRCSSAFV